MSKCPLCNEENNCAITEGEKPESCWCMKVSISKQLLENISLGGNDCICKKCIDALNKD
ncbi:MAG: cysteine-rich CWC family protein [Bacillota bacterium]